MQRLQENYSYKQIMNSPNTKGITIQDSSDIHKAEHVEGNPEGDETQ